MSGDQERATVQIGHWTDVEARTGCTVILFDRLVQAVVDVRGGAPGTRETDLLAADRTVGAVDAILLTGGSAHGLAAADGVMQFLREAGRGVGTSAGRVPIVSAAVIYDLGVGQATWPTTDAGYAAATQALPIVSAVMGRVGVGIGATYRKAWPDLGSLHGGLGIASHAAGDQGDVWAVVAFNALGDIVDQREALLANPQAQAERTNTTLIAVILDGPADDRTLRRCAIAAHDGLARSVFPAHTQWDGDLAYVCTTVSEQQLDQRKSFAWAVATELAVEAAIRLAAA